MQALRLDFGSGFEVVARNARAQAAVMTLAAGESVGGPDNRHEESDQWLFVVSGNGLAVIEGQQIELESATLLVIERGEGHEIRNTGAEPLETLNIYVPPAY